jgi:tetratricopeptide (TPR) repeat protein
LRSIFAAAIAIALVSAPAYGFVYCDDPSRGPPFYKARAELRKALAERRFADLERHFGGVLAAHESGRITDAEVDMEFGMFYASRAANEPLHADWVKANPKSRAARLAHAYYWIRRGWAARGGEVAAKTDKVQFAAMEHAFRKALGELEAGEAMSKKPTPEWARRIDVLKTFGAGEEMAALYAKAIARFPDTIAVRSQYAFASVPQWGGSLQRLAAIRADAAALPADDRRYAQWQIDNAIASGYAAMKDTVREAEAYERAMPACKAFTDSAQRLIQIYGETRNFAGLIRAANHFIGADPRSGWALANRGWAYLSTNKLEEAFRDYEKAVELGHPGAYEHLAWFYEGGRGGAKQDFRTAIDLYMIAHSKGVAGAKEKADKVRAGTGLK